MPELPDVAGFKLYIDATALHKKIRESDIVDERILRGITKRQLCSRLRNREFVSTMRRGKWLFVELDRSGWLVLHFGMTGSVKYSRKPDGPPPHTRVLISFANKGELAYCSMRMLGRVSFTSDPDCFAEAHDLGPDALSDALDSDLFADRVCGHRSAIKTALMNQSVVSGIGNVYADEILFQAGIHPQARADRLASEAMARLFRKMRRVLRIAAKHGGKVPQLPDGYLLRRRGDDGRCPKCGAMLKKTRVSGRTSYFCPRDQSRR